MENEKLEISALVKADPKRVWECYTAPEHITQWNFAAPEWHCPHAENDLRPGGKYLARMEARDGSMGFDFEGIYSVVTPQQNLVYALSDGRTVETQFVGAEGGVRVSTRFDPDPDNPLDMQRMGWQAILDNFKSYTEG